MNDRWVNFLLIGTCSHEEQLSIVFPLVFSYQDSVYENQNTRFQHACAEISKCVFPCAHHPSPAPTSELAIFNGLFCFGFTLSKGLRASFVLQFNIFVPYSPSFEDQAKWERQGEFKEKIRRLKKVETRMKKQQLPLGYLL